MSETAQMNLAGEPAAPEPHLTDRFPGDAPKNNPTPIQKDNEWYCRECNNRVTRSQNEAKEYGHKNRCSHSCWGEVNA